MSAQHTSAPWWRRHYSGSDAPASIVYIQGGDAKRPRDIATMYHCHDEEQSANADLIVAAAAMRVALQTFANIGEYSALVDAIVGCMRPHERDGVRKAFADAKAAIKQARGES